MTDSKDLAIVAVKETAQMVAGYASNLLNNERAKEFAARVSLLAKQDQNIAQAIQKQPDAFLVAMMSCVQLDLMPNTPEQHAFIIAYGGRVQFQVGYKGLKELALRSGEVKTINGELVFEGDTFDVEFGTERKLTHKPNFDVDRTDFTKVTHVYITTVLQNGERPFFVMTKAEIEKIHQDAVQRNGGKDSPAWKNWWDQQALKTVLKRAAKMLPASSKDNRLALAAELDSLAIAGKLALVDGDVGQRSTAKPALDDAAKDKIKLEASAIANQLEAEAGSADASSTESEAKNEQ